MILATAEGCGTMEIMRRAGVSKPVLSWLTEQGIEPHVPMLERKHFESQRFLDRMAEKVRQKRAAGERLSLTRETRELLHGSGILAAFCEQRLQLASKFLVRIRLEKPGRAFMQAPLMQGRLPGISGREQHFELGV